MMKDHHRCEDVADKIVRFFGWRQTYPVQKLQRNIVPKSRESLKVIFACFNISHKISSANYETFK